SVTSCKPLPGVLMVSSRIMGGNVDRLKRTSSSLQPFGAAQLRELCHRVDYTPLPMPPKSVYLETFGCQMNELDSELVMGQLAALGYRFVGSPEQAEIVLYNTCSVRDLAEQKVRSRLGEMAVRKKEDTGLVVGVLGCMAER